MKKRIALLLCVCLASALMLGACANAQAQGLDVVYAGGLEGGTSAAPVEGFAKGVTGFSLELFKEAAQGETKNVFLSPASVALALGMTQSGARGDTAEEMRSALGLEELSSQDVNEGFRAMAEALERKDEKTEVRLSNALWANKDVKIADGFIADNKQYYGAALANLDFSSPDAVRIINDWVKEKTDGKIDGIVDQIDRDTILFIMNAIWFEGSWSKQFDPDATSEAAFYGVDGEAKVQMMRQEDIFEHANVDGGQFISLPYGDGSLAMYVFLPDKESTLDAAVSALDESVWSGWIDSREPKQGMIALPQFKLEYEAYLKETLTALGMANVFDSDKADFTGIAQAAYIHDVRHKAFIDVDEKGTRAAAVTSVEMRVTSAVQTEDTFTMTVDRPFLFAIAEQETGTILFMGAVKNL
jgi:serine protease inhibitor